MTAPQLVPESQGAHQLAGQMRLQANVTYDSDLAVQPTADWKMVYDVVDLNPGTPEWDKADTTTYDNVSVNGIVTKTQKKIAQSRVITGSRLRKRHTDPDDNAGWLALFNAAKANKYAQVRWFNVSDTQTPGEQAIVDVTYDQPGGAAADNALDNFTLELQETAQEITNPQVAATPPDATSHSGNAAQNVMITITGTNLIGVTSVTFGGTASPLFEPVNATTLRAVVPTGAAGAANIVVTGPGGTDAALPFSRT